VQVALVLELLRAVAGDLRARRIRAVILTEQPVNDHLGPRRQRVHPGLFLLACVYASPRRPQKVVFCMQGALSEAAVCIFTCIETKAALGTSTWWAKATHPWTVDLVTVTAAGILVVGIASALVAHLVR
jgi:hypothetical protein